LQALADADASGSEVGPFATVSALAEDAGALSTAASMFSLANAAASGRALAEGIAEPGIVATVGTDAPQAAAAASISVARGSVLIGTFL
jgi:hypothetical protein